MPRWITKQRLRILAFIGVLLLAATGAGVYAFPQWILCVESGSAQADLIIIPGGGSGERARSAVELYRQGAAPRILLTGYGGWELTTAILHSSGVPPDAIAHENRSRSTRENALLTAPSLKAQGVEKAIIVTSWYHSRRALHCFEHYAPDIKFYSRPSYYGYPRSHWSREGLTRIIFSEYPKLLFYWIRFGICPF